MFLVQSIDRGVLSLPILQPDFYSALCAYPRPWQCLLDLSSLSPSLSLSLLLAVFGAVSFWARPSRHSAELATSPITLVLRNYSDKTLCLYYVISTWQRKPWNKIARCLGSMMREMPDENRNDGGFKRRRRLFWKSSETVWRPSSILPVILGQRVR